VGWILIRQDYFNFHTETRKSVSQSGPKSATFRAAKFKGERCSLLSRLQGLRRIPFRAGPSQAPNAPNINRTFAATTVAKSERKLLSALPRVGRRYCREQEELDRIPFQAQRFSSPKVGSDWFKKFSTLFYFSTAYRLRLLQGDD
jgi:hypothetical protein